MSGFKQKITRGEYFKFLEIKWYRSVRRADPQQSADTCPILRQVSRLAGNSIYSRGSQTFGQAPGKGAQMVL
jgi:hypothetical protein